MIAVWVEMTGLVFEVRKRDTEKVATSMRYVSVGFAQRRWQGQVNGVMASSKINSQWHMQVVAKHFLRQQLRHQCTEEELEVPHSSSGMNPASHALRSVVLDDANWSRATSDADKQLHIHRVSASIYSVCPCGSGQSSGRSLQ